MSKILITGGNGLIGKALAKKLYEGGHEIAILSRNSTKNTSLPYEQFYWNISNGEIDNRAVENTTHIVHLAGENVANKKWTRRQKQKIEDSRVKSLELIFATCLKNSCRKSALISSSAIGYYGTFTSEKILTENNGAGSDFLAKVGEKWEKATDLFSKNGIRTVKIRTGVVLSKEGAAYPKIAKQVKLRVAAAIGSGKQYVPWIHIDDIVNIYIKAIEDENILGAYNGVAPEHVTNKEMVKAIAKSLNKPFLLPNVPSFIIKATFGEMSSILLKGSRISSDKIIKHGFQFSFPDLQSAVEDLAK